MGEVFGNAGYILLALFFAAALFAFAAYLPNFRILASFIGNPAVPTSAKMKLLWALLEGIGTSVMPLSVITIAIVSLLFGINAAMLIYQWQTIRSGTLKSGIASSIGGIASGIFGVGCTACGSYFGAAILAFFGVSGAIALLPLHGTEFGIAGIILLLFSIRKVSVAIQNHGVCAVAPSDPATHQV